MSQRVIDLPYMAIFKVVSKLFLHILVPIIVLVTRSAFYSRPSSVISRVEGYTQSINSIFFFSFLQNDTRISRRHPWKKNFCSSVVDERESLAGRFAHMARVFLHARPTQSPTKRKAKYYEYPFPRLAPDAKTFVRFLRTKAA